MRQFPELALFEDKAERERELRAAYRKVMRRWWAVALLVVVITSLGVFAALQAMTIPVRGMWVSAIQGAIGGYLCASIWQVFEYAFYKPIQRKLRARLLELGIPVCMKCGYDLRGQTEPRCPECGAPFDPALLSTLDGSAGD